MDPKQKMHTSKKMHSLTALRFIAAAVVVVFHFGKGTALYDILPPILTAGPLMVTFFFVLSGFVLSVSSRKSTTTTSRFYINRLSRILPIYVVALAAYFLFSGQSPAALEYIPSLLMIQSWIPTFALIGNAPAWSISVELFFYALTPAFIAMHKYDDGRSWKIWVVGAAAFWVVSQACLFIMAQPPIYKGYPSASHDLLYYFPVSHLCSFVLGFAAGIAFQNGVLENANKRLLLAGAFIMTTLANYIRGHSAEINEAMGYTIPFGSSFLAIVFLPIIYLVASAERSRKLSIWPWLILLGEASYSMYILQLPMHIAFDRIVPENATSSPDARFAIFFAVLTAASVLSYRLIEIPARDAIKKAYASFERRKLILASSR